jgi:hypothetical protein
LKRWQLKYLGKVVTNQTCIHEEIKRKPNLGNACYHGAQNLWSSHLLSENIKFKIFKTMTVVLYGCETWSLMLREEHKVRLFENRVFRRVFGPIGNQV